jgi:hypothetical protein
VLHAARFSIQATPPPRTQPGASGGAGLFIEQNRSGPPSVKDSVTQFAGSMILLPADFLRAAASSGRPPRVLRLIRNLVYESAGGFSLPVSPGRFFPDFIVELLDGRMAIIEYKGRHLARDPEQLHKKEVGELWAARSGARCVFAWVADRDWAALDAALVASA